MTDDKAAKPSKALVREWYAKLEEDGFSEIEYNAINGDGPTMKAIPRLKATHQESGYYWVLVGRFLYRHDFGSERDRAIWEAYSEGKTCREIERLTGTSRNWANQIIRKLSKIMLALPQDED